MSPRSRDEIVRTVRYHYQRTTRRREKSRLLDEFCRLLACTRKHAIKVLRGQKRAGTTDPGRVRGGPRPRYQAAEKAVLKSLWLLSDQPCGKRLKAVLPWWIRSWEREHGVMDECARQRLLRMSAAQIDRVLKPFKVAGGKRVPRAAADVLSQIPVRSGPWCEEGPGWIEADTVSHCGGDSRGAHGWSVVLTDIATGWTEVRMSWTRSELRVHQCLAEMEPAFPFPVRGFDSDNGGEFINAGLLRHWRNREQPVEVTRSRPYHKNDNAHVEQKNRTRVREPLGEDRIDDMEAVQAFSEGLRLQSLLDNLFTPTLKLLSKSRDPVSGRLKRHYEKHPRTPAQRALESNALSEESRASLLAALQRHDPLTLRGAAQGKFEEAWRMQLARIRASDEPDGKRPASEKIKKS